MIQAISTQLIRTPICKPQSSTHRRRPGTRTCGPARTARHAVAGRTKSSRPSKAVGYLTEPRPVRRQSPPGTATLARGVGPRAGDPHARFTRSVGLQLDAREALGEVPEERPYQSPRKGRHDATLDAPLDQSGHLARCLFGGYRKRQLTDVDSFDDDDSRLFAVSHGANPVSCFCRAGAHQLSFWQSTESIYFTPSAARSRSPPVASTHRYDGR